MGLNTERFPQVEGYRELNLGREDSCAQDLFAHVAYEAEQEVIALTATGDNGAWGAGMTPGMTEWFNTQISSARRSAIGEMEERASQIRLSDHATGFLEEARTDEIERNRARRKAETIEEFNQAHAQKLDELRSRREEYEVMRAEEGGRDAKVPNRLLEWGVLLPGILIPEALLNFESFRRAPIIQSDFMALGATILVGVFIAVAAYGYGLYIRRINYYWEADNDQRQRSGWPLVALGSALLGLALVSVAAARYYYLLPLIEETVLTGGTPPNVIMSIGALLAGNLGCFFAGAIFTFLLHDPNPEFADRAIALKKIEDRVNTLMKSGPVRKLDEIDRAAREARLKTEKSAKQMSGKPGYAELKTAVSAFGAKDGEVVGLLQRYRSMLIQELQKSNRQVRIQQRDVSGNLAYPLRTISLAEFTALPIHLHWGQG